MNFRLLLILCCIVNASVAQVAFADPTIEEQIGQLPEQIQTARQQGNLDSADGFAQQLLELSIQLDLPAIQADAYFEQARNAMERNRYPGAQYLLLESIELYQAVGSRNNLAEAYRQLGLTYRYQANYPQALEYIYLAMQINQQLDDKRAISSTYNSIGVVLEKMGQYEEAAQAHHSALEINYELGDDSGVASALYNLGDIRRSMGDAELALGYFKQVLELDLKSGRAKDIAYSNHKIGFVLLTQGKYKQARVHILEALTIFQEIETPRDTDWALTSLAQLEMEEGNLEKAKEMVLGVIERAIDNQYNSLLVDAYLVAAEVTFRLGEADESLKFIEAGLLQAQLNKERHQEAVLERLRVKVLLKQESLQQAFLALQRQKELDDEILNEKRLTSIASVQAQTEFIRRAHQIELLEKESALQQAAIEKETLSRNTWLITVVGISIVLFLLYGRIMQFRHTKKLEQEVDTRTLQLEEANKELVQAYREMEAISLTDKLTGIKNRRFLEKQIGADLEQSQRQYQNWRTGKMGLPKQADIVMFMIDVDNFKDVNDVFGHGAGDRVLIQLTERMAKVFRQSDYLVRWGGEEFVAVARFIDRKDASALAQRMLEAVSEELFELTDRINQELTCSIGYASYPLMLEDNIDKHWHGLISMADACLYAAKYSGKNSWIGAEKLLDKDLELDDVTPKKLNKWQQQNKIKIVSSIDSNEDIRWQAPG